jgi:hypothetical protein
MKLSQSNVIFFCLFAAFIVFITLRGELPKYLDVVFKTQAGGETNSASASGSGGDASTGIGGFLSDPVGAITGSVRRSLGIGNGLPDIGSILRGGAGLGGAGLFGF